MGSEKRLAAIPMIAVAVAVIGAIALASSPALAHGGADEAGSVDLVEQALAIVVNSPDAVGEASSVSRQLLVRRPRSRPESSTSPRSSEQP